MSRIDTYFSDTEKLAFPYPMKNGEFAVLFPGINGVRSDGFSRLVGRNEVGEVRPVTRVIYYKTKPSLHRCDARCESATGHNCECCCGGKNHGIAA